MLHSLPIAPSLAPEGILGLNSISGEILRGNRLRENYQESTATEK
jgi:hypothetical protein